MEIDGFKMIEKIRELKEEPYKKYKPLNDGKCSHSPSISVCVMTKWVVNKKGQSYFFRMGFTFNKTHELLFSSLKISFEQLDWNKIEHNMYFFKSWFVLGNIAGNPSSYGWSNCLIWDLKSKCHFLLNFDCVPDVPASDALGSWLLT